MLSKIIIVAAALLLTSAVPALAQTKNQDPFQEIVGAQAPLTQADVDAFISIKSAGSDENKIRAYQKSGLSEARFLFVTAKVGLGMNQLKIEGAPAMDAQAYANFTPDKDELKLIEKNKKKLAESGK